MLYGAAMRQLSEIAYGKAMHIKAAEYRVRPGSQVDLKKRPTAVRPSYRTNHEYLDLLGAHTKELGEQQEVLYASDRYALLIIFQGNGAVFARGIHALKKDRKSVV